MDKIDFKYCGIWLAIVICLLLFTGLIYWSYVDYDSLQQQGTYKLFKDHSSLIGAIVAIIGVAWMVKSNRDVVMQTAFEQRKEKAHTSMIRIKTKFDRFCGDFSKGDQIFPREPDFFDDIAKDLNYLDEYFYRYNSENYKHIIIVRSYIDFYNYLDEDNKDYSSFLLDRLYEDIHDSFKYIESVKKFVVVPVTLYLKNGGVLLISTPEGFKQEFIQGEINQDKMNCFAQQYINENLIRFFIRTLEKNA